MNHLKPETIEDLLTLIKSSKSYWDFEDYILLNLIYHYRKLDLCYAECADKMKMPRTTLAMRRKKLGIILQKVDAVWLREEKLRRKASKYLTKW